MTLRDQIKGRVRLRASGGSLYRFINSIHSAGISCWGQYCRGGVFYAEIFRSDLPAAEKMAAETGVELTAAEYTTLRSVIRRYRRRVGLIIGMLFVLTGSLYVSNAVVTIEIQGNSAVAEEDILSALERLGVKRGALMYRINFARVEEELRLMVEGVSWAGVHCTGNRVVVEVTEVVPRPEGERTRIPCNIVSAEDAVITYVSVYDGLLLHKIGDFVPAGTMLVSGVDDSGGGRVLLHHAMGHITGRYERTVRFEEEFTQVRYVPTGRFSDTRRLLLFGMELPVSLGGKEYPCMTVTETRGDLRLFGITLPVSVISRRCEETSVGEETFTEGELRDILAEKIYLYEKNFLSGDTEIISRGISEEMTEKALVYTVTYTLEGEIGEQREIFIKDDSPAP